MVTTMQGALPVCSKKVQVSYPAEYRKMAQKKIKLSAKGNSGAHMIIEISLLKNPFLRLRFQRVQQPHPAHGVTGFQFLGDACRLHHTGSMASIRSCAARSISNRCGYSFFAQNQAAVKAGPVFLQEALPHPAILADGGLRLLGQLQVGM